MFNGYDESTCDAIAVLSIEKLLYDYSGETLGSNIGTDYIWDTYFEAMGSIFKVSDADYIDEYDEYIWVYHDPIINEYYELCHKYGKMHHIRYKNNPYVIKAIRKIQCIMNSIASYSYGWCLYDVQDKIKSEFIKRFGSTPCLVIEINCDFYQPVEAVQSLTEVATFFKEGVEELKTELCAPSAQSNKEKAIQLNEKNNLLTKEAA